MFFRQIVALAVFLVLFSCDFKSPGIASSKNAAEDHFTIDYNSVDVYPLFRACNNCDAAEKQNICFEITLVNELEKILNKTKIKTGSEVSGTVFVDFLVTKTGDIKIININAPPQVKEAIPDLNSRLEKAVLKLPEVIQPATKRGIPVDVQFRLPIRIKPKVFY